MNMTSARQSFRRYLGSLGFETIVPPFALLLFVTLSFGWVAWRLINRFSELQMQISETSAAHYALYELSQLRGQIKEDLRLFVQTGDPRWRRSIERSDRRHYEVGRRLRDHIMLIGDRDVNLEMFFAGTTESARLRDSAIDAVVRADHKRAEKLTDSYLVLYRLGTAKLEDMHGFLRGRLRRAERDMSVLLERLPWMVLVFVVLEVLAVYLVIRRHRHRVLSPLKAVHRGLESVSRGKLGEVIEPDGGPVEVLEMVKNYNMTTSALKKATEELDLARRRAEDLARAKSDFLSNMSHEIRTPLNVIVGTADLLMRKQSPPSEEIQMLARSSRLLLDIVNDVLDYSRLESGKVVLNEEPTNLRADVHDIVSVLESTARRKGLALTAVIDSQLPEYVVTDQFRIKQVLLNLTSNAIKFTEKGKVEIGVALVRDGSMPKIRITVTDTGIGISEDQQERIFSRFEQAEANITRTHGGTGLGLSIVQQIVELMKGRVDVQSKVGEGTTFTVIVPVGLKVDRPHRSALKAPAFSEIADVEQIRQQSYRMLLADDSPDNRFLIRAYLQPLGVAIDEVEDGEKAVEKFKSSRYDLVLLDIQMPVMDGYEAAKRIRRYEHDHGWAPVPIVALTAFSMPHEVEKSMVAGCNAHMVKPIAREDLLRLVGGLLTHSTHLPSRSQRNSVIDNRFQLN